MPLEIDLLLRRLDTPETELMFQADQNDSLYLNNLNQTIWPAGLSGSDIPLTKRQVIAYYAETLESLMPFIKGQPITPLLYPNGIGQDYFYPVLHPHQLPSFVQTSIEAGTGKTTILIQNEETVFYLLNLGMIHFGCPIKQCLTFQLYAPKDARSFSSIAALALQIKSLLEKDGGKTFIKPFQSAHYALDDASGGRQTEWQGIDILLPSFPETETLTPFCQTIYHALCKAYEALSIQAAVNIRCQYQQELIYIQTLGQQLSLNMSPHTAETLPELFSPYSLMQCASPLVSAPIGWEELETPKGQPQYWTWQRALEDSTNRQQTWQAFSG